jgi:uncharacterized membrane protein
MEILDREIDPERAWVASLIAAIVALVGGAAVFTERVYYGFLWRYFWGPVFADAEGADCVAYLRDTGEVVVNPATCGLQNAYVASPGYTTVSTVAYMIVLLYMLVGVYFLLDRFDLSPVREFVAALVPFMLFGGAFRAVEDSFVAAQFAGVTPPIEFPASALLISPFIYFTVFFIALAAFLLAKWLQRAELTETFQWPLAAFGSVAFLGAFGYLFVLSVTTDYVDSFLLVLVATVGIATALSVGIYAAIERYRPEYNAGTGYVGLIVIWAHAIDGVANVIASDWTGVFGISFQYTPKHVANRIIIDVTNAIQPAWLTDAIGDSWTFLLVKLVVAVAIVSLFDDEFVAESRYYAAMLLVAIIAVGLGPGTRDMIRVAFGI